MINSCNIQADRPLLLGRWRAPQGAASSSACMQDVTQGVLGRVWGETVIKLVDFGLILGGGGGGGGVRRMRTHDVIVICLGSKDADNEKNVTLQPRSTQPRSTKYVWFSSHAILVKSMKNLRILVYNFLFG